ncbi:hypothetical protein DSO57_1001313 [Entomophthora muscae]|uniref:Uncharacterized protein n=1 Tax=Entomophthora muscae TaxID=34485 RepID=A0ACC2U7K8_9FUNG|nr:hypothetical protein DSO57_1001313 [Entomophthora muscae]
MLSLAIKPEPKDVKEKLQLGGGQVGRPLKTCDQCRKSRRKCDNLSPRCSLCQMRGRACTYNEIAKKMKDGLNVYTKSRSKETQMEVPCLTSRLRYWLHNQSSAVTSAYNPSLVLMATRSRVLPSLLAHLQGCVIPTLPGVANSLREDENNALTLELIEIYFNNINPYCPVVNQKQFKAAFDEPIWLIQFQLLVSTVMFVSVGYHPEFNVALKVWSLLATRTRLLLQKCYMIPHPATMQALLLLGMQFNTSDKDGLAPYSSFYLGMAHRMGIQLGYHRHPPLSPYSSEQRLRTWWAIHITEQLLMHCTGRPPSIPLCDRHVRLPSPVLPSLQTDPDTKIGDYHRFTLFYARLISRVSILRHKFPEAVTPAIRLGSVDPSPCKPNSSLKLATECWKLEAAFHQWFRTYSAPPISHPSLAPASSPRGLFPSLNTS